MFHAREIIHSAGSFLHLFTPKKNNLFYPKINCDTPSRPNSLSPLAYKLFRYQKDSETPKGSPMKSFGIVRQQVFDKKSLYSLSTSLILSMKISDT